MIQKPVKRPKTRAPEQTYEEVKYLRYLIDGGKTVRVRLVGDEVVEGKIEYYDLAFLRLTRQGAPNLFIFKHDIKYLHEVDG